MIIADREKRVVAGRLACNVALGYVGILPMSLLWAALQSGLMRDIGWSAGSSVVDDDEVAIAVFVALIFLLPLVVAFFLANFWFRRRLSSPVGRYWLQAVAAVFLPLILASVATTLWGASVWTPFDLL